MTTTEQTILSLIRKSIFGCDENFRPEVDWKAVLEEAKQQTVVGIAAGALPSDILQKDRMEWEAAKYHQLAVSITYWDAQDQLHRLLTENGIPYVILKGAAAAMLYPAPFRRSMGDIDFWVPPEQITQTRDLLLENDYHLHKKSSRCYIFSNEGIFFELHHQFSYTDLEMEDVLIAGISRAELHTVDEHAFYSLPPVENGLVLLGHLWNHLHSGVGLRHVLDWMLYVHKELDDELWYSEFSEQSEKYGLKKLAVAAAHMCRMYLGLPDSCRWYAEADEELCEELFSLIMKNGNFGRKMTRNTTFAKKTRVALSGMSRYGFFHHLQSRGEENWTACHRHPWLKPFAGIYQLFRYLVLGIKTHQKEDLSDLVKTDQTTYDLLKRLQ